MVSFLFGMIFNFVRLPDRQIIPNPNPRSFLPPIIHQSPPPSNSLLSFLKVPVMSILYSPCFPPHPSPFHRSPDVSVPHCFVLPSPAPIVSFPPCCAWCVYSHTILDNVNKKKTPEMSDSLYFPWSLAYLD